MDDQQEQPAKLPGKQAIKKPVETLEREVVVDEPTTPRSKLELLVDDPLLHKFRLEDIGVKTEDFVAIKHTFDALHGDSYERKARQVEFLKVRFPEDRKRLTLFLADYYVSDDALVEIEDLLAALKPKERAEFEGMVARRKRTIARFDAELAPDGSVRIDRLKAGAFVQLNYPKMHPLALPRHFEEASEELTEEPGFKLLLQRVAHEVFSHSKAKAIAIVLHQVTTEATLDCPFVLPDGIHQDGADFIISAIPIVLDNVIAPVSTVYDADKVPLFNTQLQVGDALFHDDRSYWHSVSDLYTTSKLGRRGTLGLDIRVLR